MIFDAKSYLTRKEIKKAPLYTLDKEIERVRKYIRDIPYKKRIPKSTQIDLRGASRYLNRLIEASNKLTAHPIYKSIKEGMMELHQPNASNPEGF